MFRKTLLLLASFLLLGYASLKVYRKYRAKHAIEKQMDSERYMRLVKQFRSEAMNHDEIIFLGNSLIENSNPDILFGNAAYKNRGISGDCTETLLARLDETTARKPAKLFLEIGINDLFERVPLSTVLANYEKILAQIKAETPSTKIFIISNLPTDNDRVNEDVRKLNEEIQNRFLEKYSATFINLHPLLELNGKLNPAYATDHVHLSTQGYEVWKGEVGKYL